MHLLICSLDPLILINKDGYNHKSHHFLKLFRIYRFETQTTSMASSMSNMKSVIVGRQLLLWVVAVNYMQKMKPPAIDPLIGEEQAPSCSSKTDQ